MWEISLPSVTLGAVLGAGLAFFAQHFLASYLGEKGKNLATKEDIAGITKIIEGIRAERAQELQDRAHHKERQTEREARAHAMRMAALERRLETHQRAYTLWRKLRNSVHSDECGQAVMECQNFWVNHCLYLDEEARHAFYMAYSSAAHHRSLLGQNRNDAIASVVKQNWRDVMDAGAIIVRCAALPPLQADEEETIRASSLQGGGPLQRSSAEPRA